MMSLPAAALLLNILTQSKAVQRAGLTTAYHEVSHVDTNAIYGAAMQVLILGKSCACISPQAVEETV